MSFGILAAARINPICLNPCGSGTCSGKAG